MTVNIPAHIIPEGFFQNIRYFCLNDRNMMFVSVFRQVFHQIIQMRHFTNSYTAESGQRVVREFSFTEITFDHAMLVICGYFQESHVAWADTAFQSTKGNFFSKRCGEDIKISDFGFF